MGLNNSPLVRLAAALFLIAVGACWAWRWNAAPTHEQITHGKMLFEHPWTPGDELAGDGDGLGPVFNADSCVACHFQGGVGGAGPNQHNVRAFEVVPVDSRQQVAAGVVHASAVLPQWQETDEQVQQLFPLVPGGLRIRNGCQVEVGDFDPVLFATINTPALFGAGKIDRISKAAIQLEGMQRSFSAVASSMEGDFSGQMAGRALGRFGWKGQFDTLEEFVAAACAMEIGLTNPLKSQPLPMQQRPNDEAKWDMDRRQLRDLVAFVASLPAPVEVVPSDPAGRQAAERGKALFSQIGCAVCHTPNLGGVEGIYSDLRLYDLTSDAAGYGSESSQFALPESHPQADEWKTPPLWGVADSAPYFHDGASPTLEAAILRHDRQGRQAREAFQALPPNDRQAVIAFLETLRAPPLKKAQTEHP